ncbi:Alanine racemase [Planctomycetes bacterium Pla163]|uniref:Alanine racemase n=1 Tax=Rohdeia mirabilis TaxID=2528008 RepID=A0A518D237_9BACT|nr:Alanine racemase [Planctomycetes bacterium Pla163]
MERVRGWAEIDLDAFEWNLDRIAAAAGAGTDVMLVVKADAYGHGAVRLALCAQARGVHGFCVGTAAEAVELRRAGVSGRILLLGTLVDEEAEVVLDHGIEICVHSTDRCLHLDALARRRDSRARVHLNADTGMGRLGVPCERADVLIDALRSMSGIEVVGLMTHIAPSRGLRDEEGARQFERFGELCRTLAERGELPGLVHAANSASLFSGGARTLASLELPTRLAVRAGIAAFGMLAEGVDENSDLRPILSFSTRVVFFKDVPTGTPIGYDGTWRAERPTRVATLPVGYDDGMNWRAGNRAQVLVRGQRVPVIGRVSMDYTTIDVTDVPGVEVGDRVTVLGRQGEQSIDALELARVCGTIPYEITCNLGRRVPRVTVRSEHRDALVPEPTSAR